jgi:hypothetical protein
MLSCVGLGVRLRWHGIPDGLIEPVEGDLSGQWSSFGHYSH